MVQCQNTRRYLAEAEDDSGMSFRCPHCSEGESYVRVSADDARTVLVNGEVARCRKDFDVLDDGRGVVVWVGVEPECVWEQDLGVFHIYLQSGSNSNQYRHQAAHEAFHRVCTPPQSFHWAHEGLAVRQSLEAHKRHGEPHLAELNRQELMRKESRCSVAQALEVRGVPYPDGFYGRSFSIISALERELGWEKVKSLALARDEDGRVCFESWARTLSPDESKTVQVLLR